MVVDDLALPLSKLRLRPSGSDAGHNGLKSIQDTLETVELSQIEIWHRQRLPKGKQVDYVLGKWTAEEIGGELKDRAKC